MPEELSERKLPEEHEWQITEKVKETHDTYTYTLRPFSASQRFNFSIGQFVTLSAILKGQQHREVLRRVPLTVLIQSHRHQREILSNLQSKKRNHMDIST